MQEWEEEIAQLRLNLDNQEKNFKKQISDLEVICSKKLQDMEQENREIKEKYSVHQLRLENTNPCKVCSEGENKSENGRQTDLEKLWQKSKSKTSISNFKPHIPPMEAGKGPMSLPTELVTDAQKEVRRLQELRRYIQEECDQLLLKKDRLKEEVGDNPWHVEQSSRSLDAYLFLGEGILRDFAVSRSVWDMAAHKKRSPCFTPNHAYKVVDRFTFFRFLQQLILAFHIGSVQQHIFERVMI